MRRKIILAVAGLALVAAPAVATAQPANSAAFHVGRGLIIALDAVLGLYVASYVITELVNDERPPRSG